MFKHLILIFISIVIIKCETNGNSTKILSTESATNATKMIVLEFVAGMGRALQQLLTANTANNKQTIEPNSTEKQEFYQKEGEKLREEINKRVNQLQTIIGTGIEVSKDRKDVMSKRILEQANLRLDAAKDRADKILREPNNSEIAVKTLRTINSGVTNLSTFVNSLLGRVSISINVNLKDKPENEIQTKTNKN